jgi:hypothetical protein
MLIEWYDIAIIEIQAAFLTMDPCFLSEGIKKAIIHYRRDNMLTVADFTHFTFISRGEEFLLYMFIPEYNNHQARVYKFREL